MSWAFCSFICILILVANLNGFFISKLHIYIYGGVCVCVCMYVYFIFITSSILQITSDWRFTSFLLLLFNQLYSSGTNAEDKVRDIILVIQVPINVLFCVALLSSQLLVHSLVLQIIFFLNYLKPETILCIGYLLVWSKWTEIIWSKRTETL